MYDLIVIVHIIVSLLLIGIVLFQADEGSGLGGAFGTSMGGGGGGSGMFGKKGAAGVVTRFTAGLVTIFLITSFSLTLMISKEFVNKGELGLKGSSFPTQAPVKPAGN